MRIACVQTEPIIAEKARNVARSVQLVERAADDGAELIVLPELVNTGYVFASPEEAASLAEPVPDGPTVQAWIAVAGRRGVHIVAGIAEADGGELFNSAVLVGPDGLVGRFRKVHLWHDEKSIFAGGNLGFPVYPTPLGRIGMAICYDGWFPETYRLLALNGADIVCVPTNWVPMPGQPADRQAMANTLAMAAAHSNGLIVACADRIGVERGQPFEGQSLIVDRSGWPLAGPASRDREELLFADVTVASRQRVGVNNDVLGDRRTDVYAERLGAGPD